jgi:hypothetical protein
MMFSSTTPAQVVAPEATAPPALNERIEHITEIHAPIEKVWEALIDIDNWDWNKVFRLEADKVAAGLKGTLKVASEGKNGVEWESFECTFGDMMDPESYTLHWTGSVGVTGCLFRGNHIMKLEVIKKIGCSSFTQLHHSEDFDGILPHLNLGYDYEQVNKNYLLVNEALKDFVEKC